MLSNLKNIFENKHESATNGKKNPSILLFFSVSMLLLTEEMRDH
jgi:hypothetical protein